MSTGPEAYHSIRQSKLTRRVSSIFVALLFCCPALCLKAQNRSDVAERFTKAADQTDLRSASGQPFDLVAAINVLNNKGQSFPGTYRLEWKSKNQWRESIVLPEYERTRIGGDGKEWRERSINYELLQVWQLDRALEFPQRLRNSADKSSGKIKTEKAGQINLEGARVKQDNRDIDFCFDATNGVLIREDLPNGEQGGEEGGREKQYSDYVQFGGKLFPQQIQVIGQDKPSITFSVKQLAPLADVPASDFVAPPGAEEWITCDQPEEPKIANQVAPEYPPQAKSAREEGIVLFYALIGADGVLHNLKLIANPSDTLSDSAFKAITQWRYDPSKCGGVAVPTERFISVVFSLN